MSKPSKTSYYIDEIEITLNERNHDGAQQKKFAISLFMHYLFVFFSLAVGKSLWKNRK